jgi:hypothetical protein
MQAIRTALGQYIYTAEDVDAELAKKNARIAELEKALGKLIDACHEPDDDDDPQSPVNEAKRALMER